MGLVMIWGLGWEWVWDGIGWDWDGVGVRSGDGDGMVMGSWTGIKMGWEMGRGWDWK